jgi:hypothetical protein
MGRTMTGGANQLTLRQHMLAQEDKPMDGENISFNFEVMLMHVIVMSMWFTPLGWVYLIHRLTLGS